MMAEKNKALAQQLYDAFNADDWNKVGTVIDANFVDHNPEPGQEPGIEGLKKMFAGYRAAFPDMKMTVNHMLADGDMVVAHITVTMTNTGSFMGMPPTGKSVTMEGYDMLRFENGKGVEHWGIFDMASMMQQLGMMPPPGGAPAGKNIDMKKK